MVYNFTSSGLDSQKVSKILSSKILWSLEQELQQFSPMFFSQAGQAQPQNAIPLTDVSDQVPGNAQKGDTIRVSVAGKFTARDKVANSPVITSVNTWSTISLTLNKHKYVAISMEDVAKAVQGQVTMDALARYQAKAIAEAFERDIATLATGFSTTVGTGDGYVISFDTFGEVNRKFYANGIDVRNPENRAVAYVNPYAYEDILQGRDEYQIAGQKGLDQANKGELIETPHGILISRSNYLTTTGGATKGLVLTKEGIMVAFGIKPRVQSDYILAELATLQVADVFYGVAEMRDVAGILLNADEVNA
jgi:hypothetical protein